MDPMHQVLVLRVGEATHPSFCDPLPTAPTCVETILGNRLVGEEGPHASARDGVLKMAQDFWINFCL